MNPAFHPAYRPDIDGLRAIAVLSVLVFHAVPEWLTGGFVGVDIFFVISGYLITSILFKQAETGRLEILDFYARRIRRIFPALIVVLSASLLAGWLFLLPDEFLQLGKHVVASTFFLQNFQLWSEAGYFDVESDLKPLLHLWSLAIEEQFYLCWPLMVFLIRRNRYSVQIIFLLFMMSFLVSATSLHDRTAAFYFPYVRFWELLAGALLARLGAQVAAVRSWQAQLLSVVGTGLIVFSLLSFNRETVFPGWIAILPVAGTVLVILAGPSAALNRFLLASAPMVWVGLISYPLYLWHWPILSFLRILDVDVPVELRVAAMAVAILLAWLTYHVVEIPLRRKGGVVALILSGAMLLIAAFGWQIGTGNVSARAQQYIRAEYVKAATDFEYPGTDFTLFESSAEPAVSTGKRVLFLGDSNMEQYWPRIDELTRQGLAGRSAVFATNGGCLPVLHTHPFDNEECASIVEKFFSYALQQPDIDTVVIAAQWYSYFYGIGYRYHEKDGESLEMQDFSSPGALQAYAQLKQMIATLRQAGKQVYIILNIPIGGEMDPRNLVQRSWKSLDFGFVTNAGKSRSSHEEMMAPVHNKLRSIASETGAIIIDPAGAVCDTESCRPLAPDGWPAYKDREHWNSHFVRRHATFLDPLLQ